MFIIRLSQLKKVVDELYDRYSEESSVSIDFVGMDVESIEMEPKQLFIIEVEDDEFSEGDKHINIVPKPSNQLPDVFDTNVIKEI